MCCPVTISVAKRKGTNAIVIADQVIEKVKHLQGTLIPGDVNVVVTRNYGETASEKSNELLLHDDCHSLRLVADLDRPWFA